MTESDLTSITDLMLDSIALIRSKSVTELDKDAFAAVVKECSKEDLLALIGSLAAFSDILIREHILDPELNDIQANEEVNRFLDAWVEGIVGAQWVEGAQDLFPED